MKPPERHTWTMEGRSPGGISHRSEAFGREAPQAVETEAAGASAGVARARLLGVHAPPLSSLARGRVPSRAPVRARAAAGTRRLVFPASHGLHRARDGHLPRARQPRA